METVVSSNNLGFLVALALVLVALATIFVVSTNRARRSHGSWQDLLKQLHSVDRSGVERIAHDILDDDDGCFLDSEEIWPLVGGLKGLEAIEQNCAVLVELAFYVQKWHPEAIVIAEQLRLNAREIEWHVARLKGAEKTGNLESAFPGYAQRAVATYYLMTKNVLALYEQGGLPEFAQLQQAL